jgi:hypothetical protein
MMVVRRGRLWGQENSESNAMMGERKIETQERSSLRPARQARQNPHAAPAFSGALEQDAASLASERVGFDQTNGSGPFFLSRQLGWIFRPAERTYRTA